MVKLNYSFKDHFDFMATLIRHVDVCRGLSIIFLDYLSCRIFVISILCPFDVLSGADLTLDRVDPLPLLGASPLFYWKTGC